MAYLLFKSSPRHNLVDELVLIFPRQRPWIQLDFEAELDPAGPRNELRLGQDKKRAHLGLQLGLVQIRPGSLCKLLGAQAY